MTISDARPGIETEQRPARSPARKPWLDGLRAVAMLLVIIGHIDPGTKLYYVFTSPVKIPLFFAISGYLLDSGKKRPARFFTDVFWHLVVPWLLGSVLGVLIRAPFKGLDQLPGSLLGIFTEVSLWFLPCCIFAEVLWYLPHRFLPNARAACAATVALFAVGVAMMKLNVCNAMMFNRAFIAQFYLLTGHLFRRFEDRLSRLKPSAVAGLCALYVALGFVSLGLWPGRSMDVHLNRYYNLPFCMLMVFVGCLALFLVAQRLPAIPRALQFIGRNTLIFYITHLYAVSAMHYLLRALHLQPSGWIAFCVSLPFVCLFSGPLSVLATRWFPMLAGRYRPGKG